MKAELRKEYAEIFNKFRSEWSPAGIESAVLACQELADRPPRELTDAEIDRVIVESVGMDTRSACRYLLQAHIEKQREPETVTVEVRLYRTNSGQPNCVSQVDASLDANFPFGNPVYKWIGDAFEITREIEKGPK